MEFLLLGPTVVKIGGREANLGRRKERALLTLLLLNVGTAITIDRIIESLWDDPPRHPRAAIYVYISRLRQSLEAIHAADASVTLASRPYGYVLMAPPELIDVHQFLSLIDEARVAVNPRERTAILLRALELWRGEALADISSPDLRQRLSADLVELRLSAQEMCIEAQLETDQYGDLIPELAKLVAAHPTRERLVAAWMLALYRGGRQQEALQVYDRTAASLADTLGIDPGTQLRELHVAILRGESIPVAPATTGAPVRSGRDDSTPPPRQLPRDLYGMIDRTLHVARLDDIVLGALGSGIAILTGMAGVGKTTLAVHWAHRVADHFPDGQLYVNLQGFDASPAPLNPVDVLRDFLVALGHEPQRLTGDQDVLASLYRSRMAGQKVLVVLDNARDAAQVRPLLPGSPGSAVLVTSRNLLSGLVATDGAEGVPLDVLSEEEAAELMIRRLGADRVKHEPDAAADIVAYCAHLPLALAIVTANAAASSAIALATVASQLRRSHTDLSVFQLDDGPSDIGVVFSWSYDLLSPGASALFRALGSHPIAELSLDAAASLAGLEPATTQRHMTELIRANLASEISRDRFTSHDLLRLYAREKALAVGDDQEATHRLLDHYVHSAFSAALHIQPGRVALTIDGPRTGVTIASLTDRDEAMAWLDIEHDALLALATQAGAWGFDTHIWQLAWCLSQYLYFQGRWHDWLRVQAAALVAARRLNDDKAMATSHRGLGQVLIRLGQHREAEGHLNTARILSSENGDLNAEALAIQTLADLYSTEGRAEDALDLFHDALAIYGKTGSVLGRAQTLNNIAMRYMELGRYDKARASGTEALSVFASNGEVHGMSAAYDTLGNIYYNDGDIDSAIGQFQLALQLNQDIGERYFEAETLTRLSEMYEAIGKRTSAVDALEQALDILTELDHSDAPGVRAKLDALKLTGGTILQN